MLALLTSRNFLFFSKFKLNQFTPDDYKTMCFLIKYKVPIFNELIVVGQDVKLLAEDGKLIGKYQASQARRKAASLNKDIILMNAKADPPICKLSSFRDVVINKFYNEVVVKRNEEIIRKVSEPKQLKIPINMKNTDLKIKSKQIIELSKKNLKVRVYVSCKLSMKDQALEKLELLQSEILNKCYIEEDLKEHEYESQEQQMVTISFVAKSKTNEFMELLNETKGQSPQAAIQVFLKRYKKQQDPEMKEMMSLGKKIGEESNDDIILQSKMQKKEVIETRIEGQSQEEEIQPVYDEEWHKEMVREAKARILKNRLEAILQIPN